MATSILARAGRRIGPAGTADAARGRRLLVLTRSRWLTLLSIVGLALFVVLFAGLMPGGDARIFYDVRLPDAYTPGATIYDPVYNYSPAFAWWIAPLQVLPFEWFMGLILAAEVAALAYLVTPPIALVLIAAQVPPIWLELAHGNLNLVSTALVVLGVRYGALWAPQALSKITPAVGIVWQVARGEWRAVAISAAVLLGLALPSLILFPGAWGAFVDASISNVASDGGGRVSILIRGAIAAGVIWWGARHDEPWTVPVAVTLVAHTQGYGWLAVLGVIRLLRMRGRLRPHRNQG